LKISLNTATPAKLYPKVWWSGIPRSLYTHWAKLWRVSIARGQMIWKMPNFWKFGISMKLFLGMGGFQVYAQIIWLGV